LDRIRIGRNEPECFCLGPHQRVLGYRKLRNGDIGCGDENWLNVRYCLDGIASERYVIISDKGRCCDTRPNVGECPRRARLYDDRKIGRRVRPTCYCDCDVFARLIALSKDRNRLSPLIYVEGGESDLELASLDRIATRWGRGLDDTNRIVSNESDSRGEVSRIRAASRESRCRSNHSCRIRGAPVGVPDRPSELVRESYDGGCHI